MLPAHIARTATDSGSTMACRSLSLAGHTHRRTSVRAKRGRLADLRHPRGIRGATGQEQHGVEVDFGIFEDMTPPDPSRRRASDAAKT